jgi:putative Holliday junction resolvase
MPEPPTHGAAPPARLILGFDYGERRIGVATGGALTGGARPLGVVDARSGVPDWAAIGRHLRDWQPELLVVGVPYNMDGTPGRLTVPAQDFAAQLRQRFNVSVTTVDERLSSHEAQDRLRQQRASGERQRRVRPGDVDAMAACVLVEQWLRGMDRASPNE